MKVLLITVAGLSSRFSESVGYSCLKCLFHKTSVKESLLYRLLDKGNYFDKIVIVGGFRYAELCEFVGNEFPSLQEKIRLVENQQYANYGSCYSLYMGIDALKNIYYDELVFAEGDLYFDETSFSKICCTKKNIMTYNRDPILAQKSVAFYFDCANRPHYIYDDSHDALNIKDSFLSIYNSGQVWKFMNRDLLQNIFFNLTMQDFIGTNLIPINAYFQQVLPTEIELIGFKEWINCNTIDDFNQIGEQQ